MRELLTAPRVWKFGANIDTDLMLPGSHLWATQEERKKVVFRANRPGWVDLAKPGDAMVMGSNFGIGSSRPASLSLKLCGIRFVLADSINGLFFRNCVNYGLLAFEAPGVSDIFEEGDPAEVSIDTWQARNVRTGATVDVLPVPEMPLTLMLEGGIVPMLERRGLIRKADPDAPGNSTARLRTHGH
jgi:3-isopropylmalate/(R)-2-methylmalate dehydratase small subunit